jgi:hypothetical protein
MLGAAGKVSVCSVAIHYACGRLMACLSCGLAAVVLMCLHGVLLCSHGCRCNVAVGVCLSVRPLAFAYSDADEHTLSHAHGEPLGMCGLVVACLSSCMQSVCTE